MSRKSSDGFCSYSQYPASRLAPHINSIIDIYNVEALHSLLAIGGHDFDKIEGQVEFTVSQKEDVFLPILSKEKHVAKTDYVYRDAKGILAWLDVRDSEYYKFDEETKDAIFIIQGMPIPLSKCVWQPWNESDTI